MATMGSSVLLLSLLLAGCTSGGPKPGLLRVQLPTEPVSLDPSLAEDGASIRVMSALWWGLDRLSTRSVSTDGRIYTFRVKPDARWSDGRLIQAQDFELGLKRSLAPATAAKLAPMLYPIRGARAYHEGKVSTLTGVSSQGDSLRVELERATPYFPLALKLSMALPLRQDILDANGGKWPPMAPTTGPFRLKSYERGRKLVLVRNGEAQEYGVSELEFLLVSDEAAAVSLFERGGLDILARVPTLDLERLRAKGGVRTEPFAATYYVGFNVKKPPFDRKSWRQAVAHAVNKPEIAQAVGTGETPAMSWIPPGLEGYQAWVQIMERRKPQARYTGGPVTASFDTSARNQLVMEKVQNDVLGRTGMRLALTNLDWKSYIHELQTNAPPLFRFAWLAPFADPVPHLQVFTSGNPNNYTGWSNAGYDRLVHEIEGLEPGPKRLKAIQRAQDILLYDEVVVVPLYHYVQNHALADRVRIFNVTPFGGIAFDEILISD